jgi:hypothetical protein
MGSSDKSAALNSTVSFEEVLDETCDKLKERQTHNSLLRIQKMEDRLSALEEELEVFLLQKDITGPGGYES